MALKFRRFIARIAVPNFSVLNKSPPSVLPAFSHKLCVRLARSSINVLREGSPPTHFSASETVTTNRLGMQIRAQCWQKHVQLSCAVNISDSITVFFVTSKSNTFKTAHNAASVLCSDIMEKLKWQKSSKQHTKHVHYSVHNTFFVPSASHQHTLEKLCYLHNFPCFRSEIAQQVLTKLCSMMSE